MKELKIIIDKTFSSEAEFNAINAEFAAIEEMKITNLLRKLTIEVRPTSNGNGNLSLLLFLLLKKCQGIHELELIFDIEYSKLIMKDLFHFIKNERTNDSLAIFDVSVQLEFPLLRKVSISNLYDESLVYVEHFLSYFQTIESVSIHNLTAQANIKGVVVAQTLMSNVQQLELNISTSYPNDINLVYNFLNNFSTSLTVFTVGSTAELPCSVFNFDILCPNLKEFNYVGLIGTNAMLLPDLKTASFFRLSLKTEDVLSETTKQKIKNKFPQADICLI